MTVTAGPDLLVATDDTVDTPGAARRPLGGAVWFIIAAIVFGLCLLAKDVGWLRKFPDEWTLPFTELLNVFMGWFIDNFRWFFRWLTSVFDVPLKWAAWALNETPWPIIVGLFVIVAHAANGWRLALFTLLSFLYMLVIGVWEPSMNTLALVALSVPMAVLVGFALGVGGYVSKRAERIILPTLDLLQTVPAFAYLIPILLLFGIGPVVGLIASILYAAPPMARNTMLGLRGVSPEVIESGLMSGATHSQLFWRVRAPTALPQIMLGVNQTTMAALSMVIIAAVIGGSNDIGVAVLRAMQKADFGVSLLAGLVIALMAMNLDRITAGFAAHSVGEFDEDHSFLHVWRHWIAAALVIVIGTLLAKAVPALDTFPKAWTGSPAEAMNGALERFVVAWGAVLDAIKNSAFFFVMLPMKIGLAQTISPFSWGFELTDAGRQGYAIGVAALSALVAVALVGGGGRCGGAGRDHPLVRHDRHPVARPDPRDRNVGLVDARHGPRAVRAGGDDFSPDRRGVGQGGAVALSVRGGGAALLHHRRTDRHLGLHERHRLAHRAPAERYAPDHAIVRAVDPGGDAVQDRRVHGADCDHALCHRPRDPLYRARPAQRSR